MGTESILIVSHGVPSGGQKVVFICNKPISREVEMKFREIENLGGRKSALVFDGSQIVMEATDDPSLASKDTLQNLLNLAEKLVEDQKTLQTRSKK